MPVLGLGDAMWTEYAMSSIRIGKLVGGEAAGIVDAVLVHALNYIIPHFRYINGWGKAAGPDVMARKFRARGSRKQRREIVLDVNRAGERAFIQFQVIQLQITGMAALRENLGEVGSDLGSLGFRNRGWIYLRD